eukprot:Sspe_Gene.39256::Locus_18938_Transcript_1_1_Confidence_1.000_Length_684::g.39256::m.39256
MRKGGAGEYTPSPLGVHAVPLRGSDDVVAVSPTPKAVKRVAVHGPPQPGKRRVRKKGKAPPESPEDKPDVLEDDPLVALVPGLASLPPAKEVLRSVSDLPVAPHVEQYPLYRNTSLGTSLSAALEHVASRVYGDKYDVTLTPLMRHEIEAEADKAIAQTFAPLSLSSSSGSIAITEGEKEAKGSNFPLYRCTPPPEAAAGKAEGTWTFVMRDAKV